MPGGSPDPCPVSRERKLLLSLSPAPRQAVFALSRVYFLPPEPDPRVEVAGGDSPGCDGIGRAWHLGKARLAGDIHPGLLCCEYQKGAGKRGPGVAVAPMGCPHTTTHGWLGKRVPRLQCASQTQTYQGVGGVGGPLPVWAVCLGDVMARGGDVQCPGFLLSRQLAGSGRTEPGCCRGGLALSSVLLAPHS